MHIRPFGNIHPCDAYIRGGGPVVDLNGRLISQHFFDHRINQPWIPTQSINLIGMTQHLMDAVADHVGGCFMTRIQHKDTLVQQFNFCQTLAVCFGIGKGADDFGI